MKNMKNIRKKIEISDSVIIMLDTSKDTVMRVRIGTGMDGIAVLWWEPLLEEFLCISWIKRIDLLYFNVNSKKGLKNQRDI